MSRAQSGTAFNTSSANSGTDQGNATSAFGNAQNDVGDYQNQLSSFVSGNPYNAGGEFDQTINTGLANTSDAGSNSLKGALQSQALRTGQNSAADAATASSAAQQNTRNLSADLAQAQQQRIQGQTGYNTTALGASNTAAQDQAGLYSTSLGGANSAEGNAVNASKTPSFWDQVGNSFGSAAGNLEAGNIFGKG